MMLNLLLFLILSKTCLAGMVMSHFGNKVFKFDKFLNPCSNKPTTKHAINFGNFTSRNGYQFDYDVRIDRRIDKVSIEVNFARCRSKELLDSCVLLPVFRAKDACRFMTTTDEVWSKLQNCLKPAMRCPLYKRQHRGKNCSLDIDRFGFFPIGHSYWKTQVYLYDNDKEVYCMVTEGGLL